MKKLKLASSHCSADFISPNAAGANFNGFMLATGQYNLAFLQVRVLKKAVMLVGKTNFVGFVATLGAHFTNAGHDGGKSFYFGLHSSSVAY